MKIGIIGGGITGTAVAYLLAQNGHDVRIFEQASECKPVGAGILLQPSGQQVLDRLGVLNDVSKVAQRLDGLSAILKSGRELVRLKYEWFDPNCFGLGVHRGELFELLLKKCIQADVTFYNDSRIERAGSDANGHWVESTSGNRFHGFDFLIGVDGSASNIRDASRIRTKVIEYDFAALWSTGACSYQPGKLVQIVDGTHKLVGLLPIGGGRSSFFWGLPAGTQGELSDTSIDTWKQEVLSICPDAESILSGLNSFDDLTFARYRHVSMSAWYDQRTIFLGDAAHATSPHLGQGVNLALEDAACFADALEHCGDFAGACRGFTRTRRSKLKYYSQLTRMLSPFFQSQGVVRGVLRDVFLPWFPYTPVVRREMVRTLCGFKNGWLR